MIAQSLVTLVSLFSLQALNHQPAATINRLAVAKYVSGAGEPPIKKNQDSLGVDVTARSAAVLDVASGNTLFEKDSVTPYPMASLTKLVTAMAFLDTKPNLDETVTIQAEDDSHEGKEVFPTGERMTKRDLLRAMLVESVNTAGNTIARITTSDREAFIAMMNKKAQDLHMRSAVYYDPTGLDSRNQASAGDIALALRAALNYPEIREATQHETVDIKGLATGHMYHLSSTNLLLNSFLNKAPYHIVAAKTGSLPEAGFCLAQDTRDQNGNEVIAVVMGSANHFARFQDAKALTAWAFMNFEWPNKQANAATNAN